MITSFFKPKGGQGPPAKKQRRIQVEEEQVHETEMTEKTKKIQTLTPTLGHAEQRAPLEKHDPMTKLTFQQPQQEEHSPLAIQAQEISPKTQLEKCDDKSPQRYQAASTEECTSETKTEEIHRIPDAGAEGGDNISAASAVAVAGFVARVAAKATAGVRAAGADLRQYEKFDPSEAATWESGGDVPYAFLAETFSLVEAERGRLATIILVANCIRAVLATSPSQLITVVSLLANKIAASYEGLELGIGDSIMMNAVAETCGRKLDHIKSQVSEVGDLGQVALTSRNSQATVSFFKPKPLMASTVLKTLQDIAKASGKDVQSRKKEMVKKMLVSAQGKEACYLVRALQGKMRIGLQDSSVLAALAHAITLTPPPGTPEASEKLPRGEALSALLGEAEEEIKMVFCELPNYEVICHALLEHGLGQLHKFAHLTAGVPVKPMLAKPTKGISEVLDRLSSGTFTSEFKYDGERAQIHRLDDGTTKVFSRNSEDMTSKYPDIASMLPASIGEGVSSFILDAEAVAVDKKTGQILPFQVLSKRKKKDVLEDDITVHVCVFAFDLLYLNGEPLLKQTLLERRELLRKSFKPQPQRFEFARSSDVRDADGIQQWLDEAVNGNCEGLMVKTLEKDATYEPSRRSLNWLKIKKDYIEGITDSCDLVPIGAYFGKGKRTGTYGAYLLACYNDEEEEFQSICKIGTGFSDTQLQDLTEQLNQHRIDSPRNNYKFPESIAPDVWFDTCQVWEVKAADLSISPIHTAAAGLVDDSKGIALRFPRLMRVRDDKSVEDSTNATQIADMYRAQKLNQSTVDDGDMDGY